jgi:hypothetical protein
MPAKTSSGFTSVASALSHSIYAIKGISVLLNPMVFVCGGAGMVVSNKYFLKCNS